MGVTESLKGQVKRDYSESPCAALCWNRHRAAQKLGIIWARCCRHTHPNSKCFILCKVKNNLSSCTGLRSSRIKDWLQGGGRGSDPSLCSEEGSQLGKKKQLQVSFEQFIKEVLNSPIPSQILNPPSDFAHTKKSAWADEIIQIQQNLCLCRTWNRVNGKRRKLLNI